MQRQKSILSFLRPPPDNQTPGAGAPPANPSPEMQRKQTRFLSGKISAGPALIDLAEVTGTDTPPEKPPRRVFPVDELNGGDSGTSSSSSSSRFSSIMHKFAKVEDGEKMKGRDQAHVDLTPAYTKSIPVSKSMSLQHQISGNIVKPAMVNQRDFFHRENEMDNLGPDTPGLKPHFKRLQEDVLEFESKNDTCFPNPSKRIRLNQDSILSNNKEAEASDTISKFEWLHSSRIKDANGRRPDDPLYDKRTLYIPPKTLDKMSATQKQYWTVKCQYMDILLFFKVGKFYELYELDAEIGHKELDWKITLSGVGKCRQVGISESGIDDAVQKLVARGYKVGVMEQCETKDQAKARGVISRELVRVITPSTQVDGNIGLSAVHLLAIKEGVCKFDSGSICYGFAFVDCAALRFWVGSIKDDGSCSALGALLMQVAPKEIIYEGKGLSKEALKAIRIYSSSAGTMSVQMTPVLPETGFAEASEVRSMIHSQGFFVTSANSWNRAFDSAIHHDIALNALGGLISHLSRFKLDDVLRNGDILPYQVYKGCLRMDGQTMVNLEIFSNNADGGILGTLYHYLDNCLTSSGKRLLRNWICHPLKDIGAINDRLNVVEELLAQPEYMLHIAQNLRKLPDQERLLGRLKSSVQSSVSLLLPLIGTKILKQLVKVFGSLVKGLRIALDLLTLLLKDGKLSSLLTKVFEVPVVSGNEGLDKFLSQFEAAIDSDFPNYQNHDVKDTDVQTLPILIELFVEKAADWAAVIHAINCIDVLRSFALTESSSSGSVSRPIFLAKSGPTGTFQEAKGPLLRIMGLWHPFALGERGALPVPNDIILGEDEDSYHARTLLLTGPNMGGKSTLLRATCLAVILAQLGCYVPCEKCTLTPVDTIFTRLGATDRIMSGESTFLVECTETASVLQNATEDSLVILDELGRGTSTFDGYAIAYAVLRHLVEKVNCRLLFATHFHPLTKEFGSHPRVMLQHMACAFQSQSGSCSRSDQELVFLYRLASGACPESYGLQVAMMAGIPEQVVESASKAGEMMKKTIGGSFRSSEQRLEFSTLHEMWLKTLVSVLHNGGHHVDDDDDALDTFFCLWHEMKSSNSFSNGLKSA